MTDDMMTTETLIIDCIETNYLKIYKTSYIGRKMQALLSFHTMTHNSLHSKLKHGFILQALFDLDLLTFCFVLFFS